jgi:hypothetical protein
MKNENIKLMIAGLGGYVAACMENEGLILHLLANKLDLPDAEKEKIRILANETLVRKQTLETLVSQLKG